MPAGGTIEIEAGSNEGQVEMTEGGGHVSRHPVDPTTKKASIPVPPVPPGTVLALSIGKGLRRKVILVEVVEQEQP